MENVIQQLRLRLPEYLADRGVEVDMRGYAKCPLHHDKKTKSFHLITEGGTTWHCFGCGKSGNIFHLAEELEGLPSRGSEFIKSTIPTLAERFRISVPKARVQADKVSKTQRLYEILRFVYNQIQITPQVEEFAKERRLDDKTLKRFGIGAIPDYKSLVRKLKLRYNQTDLESSGVLHERMYANRVLFTLFNRFGQPIAFTGRIVVPDDKAPKYINSYGSDVFDKSTYLYNYQFAHKYMKIYLVEGQMDVIRLHTAGMPNAVATSGTALTDQHIETLRKHKEVVFAYDGDAAGLSKMNRYLDKLPNARPVIIPDNHDPDSYIRNYGVKAFLDLEELDRLSWDILNADYTQRSKKVLSFLEQIAQSNSILHLDYLRKLAQTSGIEYVRLTKGLTDILNKQALEKLKHILSSKQQIKELNVSINIKE